jgi:hypothetical protein
VLERARIDSPRSPRRCDAGRERRARIGGWTRAPGEVVPWRDLHGHELGEWHPADRGLRLLQPVGSHEAHAIADAERFVAAVAG